MSEQALRLILDGAHSGSFNMQLDASLLHSAIRNQTKDGKLRFYRFSEPCWTVGYGMWKSASLREDIPAVRRITGGGIVKHGEDLTYALILPSEREGPLSRVKKSYFLIHEALARTLNRIGIPAGRYVSKCSSGEFCFDSPVTDDVMLAGKKVAGGAQKRSGGYLLHQGSIAWPLLLEAKADLSESHFAGVFANELADSLGFSVKEFSFETDDIPTGSTAWNQPS